MNNKTKLIELDDQDKFHVSMMDTHIDLYRKAETGLEKVKILYRHICARWRFKTHLRKKYGRGYMELSKTEDSITMAPSMILPGVLFLLSLFFITFGVVLIIKGSPVLD